MAVVFEGAYGLASGDQPLTNARILAAHTAVSGMASAAGDSVADGYFIDGPLNALTYERWAPDPGTAEFVWFLDFSAPASIDCICIAAHTAGTAGAVVTLSLEVGGSFLEIAATAPGDDAPIMFLINEVLATALKIEISVPCEIGVVRAGKAMQMPSAIYSGHAPLPFGRTVAFRSTRSETGEFLGRTKQRVSSAASYSWSHLPQAWVYANWPAFQRAAEEEPFFLAWRPAEFPEVGYCDVSQVPAPAFMGVADLMAVDLSVVGFTSL